MNLNSFALFKVDLKALHLFSSTTKLQNAGLKMFCEFTFRFLFSFINKCKTCLCDGIKFLLAVKYTIHILTN